VGKPSERIYIIETDPITGEVDRAKVLQLVSDMIGALFAVGGKVQIAADRVEVGTIMVGERPQAIAETQGIVVRYQSFAPVRRHDAPAPPLEADADPTPAELEERARGRGGARAGRRSGGGLRAGPDRFPDDADLMSDEEIRAELEAEAAAARG
jgi:hypothetical protein